MTAGNPLTRWALDQRAGNAVVSLQTGFANINQVKALLDDTSRASDVILLALGYSQDEIGQLRAAFTDLAKLDQVGHAQAVQAEANDFWWNAKHLTGAVGLF
jgi:hypothetical protein